jgi:hypothetical protein
LCVHVHSENRNNYTALKVLTTVVMKRSVFWDITLCGLLPATYFHAGFLLGLFFDPEDGGDMTL